MEAVLLVADILDPAPRGFLQLSWVMSRARTSPARPLIGGAERLDRNSGQRIGAKIEIDDTVRNAVGKPCRDPSETLSLVKSSWIWSRLYPAHGRMVIVGFSQGFW